MNETDLLWMSALIFAPTLFALVLLFVPKAQVELMRWIALLGTAVTLAISLIVMIGYFDVPGVLTPGDSAGLEKRVTVAAARQAITIDPQTGQTRGGAPGLVNADSSMARLRPAKSRKMKRMNSFFIVASPWG